MSEEKLKTARLAGRCADGAERDGGTQVHLIADSQQTALCGAKPGRLSAGWSYADAHATCPRCVARDQRAQGR